MQHKHQEHFKTFLLCLKETRYYDAHEVLEALWFPRRFERSNEVKFLKGCINAAVSFELHKRGRIAQSKRVWRNYLKYRQLLLKIECEKNGYYLLTLEIERHHSLLNRSL